MERRVAAILEKYPWIDPAGLAYFERRIPLAQRDAETALAWVLDEATTPEVARALRRGAALQMRRALVHPRRDRARERRLQMNRRARPRFGKGVKLRRDRDGSAMLLVPEGALVLNAPAAAALELVDGKRSFDEIVERSSKQFDVAPERAQRDLGALFERLPSEAFVSVRRPLSLLCELTYRCNLQCPVLLQSARADAYRDELSTEQWGACLA